MIQYGVLRIQRINILVFYFIFLYVNLYFFFENILLYDDILLYYKYIEDDKMFYIKDMDIIYCSKD